MECIWATVTYVRQAIDYQELCRWSVRHPHEFRDEDLDLECPVKNRSRIQSLSYTHEQDIQTQRPK